MADNAALRGRCARERVRDEAEKLVLNRVNLTADETALLLIALELGEVRELLEASRARPGFSIAAEMRHAWRVRKLRNLGMGERVGAE